MVNNNGIPFEVKKPFETVQELKNEIPSFEEFMKDYKVDERVVDSYVDELESYDDVGAEKGYGPCRVCRTKSLTWIDLYIACPVPSCPDREPGHWVHSTDGYRTQISNRARIRCSKSGCSANDNDIHMSKWRFGCSKHKGEYYQRINVTSFDKSLSIALGGTNTNPVMRDLVTYIDNHEDEWVKW